MVFERKKIQTETLGEYLLVVRQNLNMSHEDVALKTGISIKFLESLEKGNFKILPADVYVLGFLRQLAQLYLVDPDELVSQYKREKGIERQIQNQNDSEGLSWQRKIFKKIVITPKFLSLMLGLLFIFATVSYIIWQVWSINKTPGLEIFSPHNNDVVKEAFVEVKGKTDPGILVTVNGQSVFVDSDGNFHNQVGLSQGPSQIVIAATNRFGKTVSRSITLSGGVVIPDGDKLIFKMDFSSPVNIGYSIDNQDQQTLSFSAGDSKTFTANQKITIQTSDAGATRITLNGQSLGTMGKSKEMLSGVTFYASQNNGVNLSN